jgi:uracil-DNA glycosylase family 4
MDERCSACPQPYARCVRSDGSTRSRVLFIGEAPGRDEDIQGRPFVGQAGRELDQLYLLRAGLDRRQVRITNAVHCRPVNNKKPTPNLVTACSVHHLKSELESARHEILVPMGATACSLFENIQLAKHHGFPLERVLFGESYTVFPMYHPAAGLHSSNLMTPLLDDFSRLKLFLGGELRTPIDLFAGHEDYREVDHRQMLFLLCDANAPVAIDTESTGTGLWSIQFSTRPGTGYLIRPDDRAACSILATYANNYGYTMHYSSEDWPQLQRIGIELDESKLYDTIQGAFVAGTLAGGSGGGEEQSGGQWGSLGLKALAWRLAGMEMRSFQDVVRGPSKRKVLDWLIAGIETLADYPVAIPLKKKVNWKPHPAVSVLARIRRHTYESEGYDPWERWEESASKAKDAVREGLDLVLHELGPMSLMGIDLADPKDAIHYACRDADATFRLRGALESLANDTLLHEFIALQDISTFEDLAYETT